MKFAMSAVAAGLLLFGASASAQYPRYQDRQFNGDRGERASRVFDRLRADLDRIDVSPLPFTGDHARIMKAREELNRLDRQVSEGTYDPRDFDQAISAVQQVIDQNDLLSSQNRDYLTNDLYELKEYRAE